MRYLVFLGFCVWLTWGGHLVQAAEPQVVTGHVRWSSRTVPDEFFDVIVAPGAHLEIEAGTFVRFRMGSRFVVQGKMTVHGTRDRPVVLTGISPSYRWEGIRIEPGGSLEGEFLDVRWSQAGVRSENGVWPFMYLRLIDNHHNVLSLGADNVAFSGKTRVREVTFARNLSAVPPGSTGIEIRGIGVDLEIDQARYLENRLRASQDSHFVGVRIFQPYENVWVKSAHHLDGCLLMILSGDYQGDMMAGFDGTGCQNRDLPVVFVPGFGTSINLDVLTKVPIDEPQPDGWFFPEFLTRSYQVLLQALEERGVPVTIAYYDWRLPAVESAVQYLEPAIAEAKRRSLTDRVNIIAHSFGGLVARAYAQGERYADDIENLVTLGTPHQGALKAYPVWQAGQLPQEWAPVRALLRWYRYQDKEVESDVAAIRRHIPGVRDLVPAYPAITRNGIVIPPVSLEGSNPFLLWLQEGQAELHRRVRAIAVMGRGYAEDRYFAVGAARKGAELWPDGLPAVNQSQTKTDGDGTVPFFSAALSGTNEQYSVASNHADLPGAAASFVTNLLYASRPVYPKDFSNPLRGDGAHLKFFFDCPIQVRMTLPSGQELDTREPDLLDVRGAELFRSEAMTWMFVPEMAGTYRIAIEAQADTEVRYWVDNGSIRSRQLNKGEVWNITYVRTGSTPSTTELSSGGGVAPSPSPFLPNRLDELFEETATSQLLSNNMGDSIRRMIGAQVSALLPPTYEPFSLKFTRTREKLEEPLPVSPALKWTYALLAGGLIALGTGGIVLLVIRRWQTSVEARSRARR